MENKIMNNGHEEKYKNDYKQMNMSGALLIIGRYIDGQPSCTIMGVEGNSYSEIAENGLNKLKNEEISFVEAYLEVNGYAAPIYRNSTVQSILDYIASKKTGFKSYSDAAFKHANASPEIIQELERIEKDIAQFSNELDSLEKQAEASTGTPESLLLQARISTLKEKLQIAESEHEVVLSLSERNPEQNIKQAKARYNQAKAVNGTVRERIKSGEEAANFDRIFEQLTGMPADGLTEDEKKKILEQFGMDSGKDTKPKSENGNGENQPGNQ